MQPLQIIQNKIIQIMNNIKSDSRISNNFLYHKEGLLKIEHIYELEIAKFMHIIITTNILIYSIITLNLLNRFITMKQEPIITKIILYQVFRLVFQKHHYNLWELKFGIT